jgi:ATP-dependent helicase HrpA
MCTDVPRLLKRLRAVQLTSSENPPGQLEKEESVETLEARLKASMQKVEARTASVPDLTFPELLPISAHVEEIVKLIQSHQVVIICGETGSGKSTQLPKIALLAGRGRRGLIGHTQPRRLAARSLATRIAEEIGDESGAKVGYQIRFSSKIHHDTTLIKLMTDGILLAEIPHDRWLNRYDTLIIDEAHERSLNIDFILGYLKTLLVKRPELKVIITSATIDPGRFSRHFDAAPIVEVSGRGYPVEVRYRPAGEDESTYDLPWAVLQAVHEISQLGQQDILVFLPSERVIREVSEQLHGARLRHTEIVPLFGRLGIDDQMRIFRAHTGRRIVLATNVAETSLTVPGIHYVIDSGLVRVSRFSVCRLSGFLRPAPISAQGDVVVSHLVSVSGCIAKRIISLHRSIRILKFCVLTCQGLSCA